MSWELDHVFLATSDADSVEMALAEFGIAFTERRIHRGQGTANACAKFENAFFELLCPHDLEELRSDIVRPLGLDERIHWRKTGACPFGVCFRPSDAGSVPRSWPFATWGYKAAYVPTGASIPIVTPSGCLAEPLVFVSTRSKSPVSTSSKGSSLHCGARRTLTRVEVHRTDPASPVSAGVQWFVENGFFSLNNGSEYLLELEWDRGREGNSHRFLAGVPILVRW